MGGKIGWKKGGKNVVEQFCGQTGLTNWVNKLGGKSVWKNFEKKLGGKLSELFGWENCKVYSIQCTVYSINCKVKCRV